MDEYTEANRAGWSLLYAKDWLVNGEEEVLTISLSDEGIVMDLYERGPSGAHLATVALDVEDLHYMISKDGWQV